MVGPLRKRWGVATIKENKNYFTPAPALGFFLKRLRLQLQRAKNTRLPQAPAPAPALKKGSEYSGSAFC